MPCDVYKHIAHVSTEMLYRLLLAFIAERYLSQRDILNSMGNVTGLLYWGARLENPPTRRVFRPVCVCVCFPQFLQANAGSLL